MQYQGPVADIILYSYTSNTHFIVLHAMGQCTIEERLRDKQ